MPTGVMKAGGVFAFLSFLTNIGVGAIASICSPVCGIVWGIGAGILAVEWDEGDNRDSPMKKGVMAGSIAGIGAVIGLLIGAVVSFAFMGGQEFATELMKQMGTPIPDPSLVAVYQWIGVLCSGVCIGLLNVAMMAGFGALGANLYAESKAKPNII